MNRLIVLNRFFYPDHSATSQILTDLRLHFAASGVDVHVIISLMTIPRGNCRPKRPLRKCVHSAQPRETRLAPPERLR